MCVIVVKSTADLAKTDLFVEQRLSGFFGRLKERLKQLDFVFFEFGNTYRRGDRPVIFTHETFSHMIHNRCNSSVLDEVLAVGWSRPSLQHKNSDNIIWPRNVPDFFRSSQLAGSSTRVEFDLNDFPEEGQPPWATQH